jgi:hypothetical protein
MSRGLRVRLRRGMEEEWLLFWVEGNFRRFKEVLSGNRSIGSGGLGCEEWFGC